MREKGRFIMIEGIAGSGKSTIIRAVLSWLEETGKSVFDLKDWSKNNTHPPALTDVDQDVLLTFEPTRSWVGAAIRFELSQEQHPYGGLELAHAFSLDRQIMYRRLIIPALEADKTIIQDRGVSTSIVYQPIMEESLPLEELIKLPGNKLALDNAPDHLILTQIDPEIAVKRLRGRDEESKGVFAQLENLQKWNSRYHSNWFRELFEKHGTTIHTLDTSSSIETTLFQAKQLITNLLK